MLEPYEFLPACADGKGFDCIPSPISAIQSLNTGGNTTTAPGCDLFAPSTAGFPEALALAKESDYVVLALGIETCGLTKSHNVNPQSPGRCYQEKLTTGYVFPDQYLELEAHDRLTIDLPEVWHSLADPNPNPNPNAKKSF